MSLNKLRVLLVVMIGLALSVAAPAQMGQDGIYRLQPDDVLRVQMRDDNQINADIPIGPDGYISAPFVGAVKAQGKTTTELENELVALYKAKLGFRNPRMAVTILRYRAIHAAVNGMVFRPGVYEMRAGDTLLVLLANANNYIVDRADAQRATFRRSYSHELIPIDLKALLNGDTTQNYIINDGDELIVPERKRSFITVVGTVAQPGQYPYQDDMTVEDALGVARGEVKTRSIVSKIMVTRKLADGRVVHYVCDLIKYGKGDSAQNITLQPGDMVYVPENKAPDINVITGLTNTLFFFQQLSHGGILGLRL